MDFANERYVRLYVRETTTWRLLPWESQALLPHVLRIVDRAGVLDLAGISPAEALQAHLPKWPSCAVEIGVDGLIARGILEHHGNALVWPKFLDGQEAPQSDVHRQRESRARRRDEARLQELVTERDHESQNVTGCHDGSRAVTPNQPNQLNQPSNLPGADPLIAGLLASEPKPDPTPSEPEDAARVLNELAAARQRLGKRTVRRTATKQQVTQVRRPHGGRKLSADQLEQWVSAIRHAEEFCRQNPTNREGKDMAGSVLTLGNLSQPDKFSKWLERDDLESETMSPQYVCHEGRWWKITDPTSPSGRVRVEDHEVPDELRRTA